MDRLVVDALAEHGTLNGVVNAAAASSGMRFEERRVEDFEQANRVNQIGFFCYRNCPAT